MGEVLVSEKKFENFGWKITVNQELKLIKGVLSGKSDAEKIVEYFRLVTNELKKFNKGESSYLVDTVNYDMRFFSPGEAKALGEFGVFAGTHCKKNAYIVQSFMMEKAAEAVIADTTTNDKYFKTEQEAMKWLQD